MPSNKIISGIVLKKRKEEESHPWSSMGYFTVKTTLAVINFFIAILGIALFSIGIQILNIFTFGIPLDVSRALIVLGVFISIVGAVGIYGVFSEKGMYLRTYIVLISIAIILQMITIIIITTKSSQIDSYFDDLFRSESLSDIKTSDQIQNAFECCGTTNCKFSEPCGPKLRAAYFKLILPTGIAITIECLIIIICFIYISYLVKKSSISKSEMHEAWKQNNASIQKDYSKFDYA